MFPFVYHSVKQPGVPLNSSTGKEVGEVINGRLQKHVRFTCHLYRKLIEWTCDKATIEKAINLGAKFIIIFEDKKHMAYTTSLEVFGRLATPVHHSGQREQLCLPRAFWQVNEISKCAESQKRGINKTTALFA